MQVDEALVYDFCRTLHRRHVVDEALFARAVTTLIPLPAGTPAPW